MRVYSTKKKKQDLSHYKIWDPDFYLEILSQQIRRVRYAFCYNTSDETVAINTHSVTLEPYEYIREKDELFDEDSNNGYEEVELERANIFRMVSEEEKDRSTRINRSRYVKRPG